MRHFPAPEPERAARGPYHLSCRKHRRSLSEWRCQAGALGLGAQGSGHTHAAGRAGAEVSTACGAGGQPGPRRWAADGTPCGRKGRSGHLFFCPCYEDSHIPSLPPGSGKLFSRVSKDTVPEVLLPGTEALLFYLLAGLVQVTVSPKLHRISIRRFPP